MTIYALKADDRFYDWFATSKLAEAALRKKRDEIVRRGVSVTTDEPRKFTFYFGWEERGATWHIVEIDVRTQ